MHEWILVCASLNSETGSGPATGRPGGPGIYPAHIHVDKKSGATTARPRLQAALAHARAGDVLVILTLDRSGRTVRDTLNLVHDLTERGVGVRTLADPLAIDTAEPESPMSYLAFLMLALFGQKDHTYAAEGAAHARRWPRPTAGGPGGRLWSMLTLEHAALLRASGSAVREKSAKTGLKRTTLYRHLPPRSPTHPGTKNAL